jgi:hypothetical protein
MTLMGLSCKSSYPVKNFKSQSTRQKLRMTIFRHFLVYLITVGFYSASLAQVSENRGSSQSLNEFFAVGPKEPIVKYLSNPSSAVPHQLRRVAVEVHFNLVPTMMRFSMPCFPCMVTENNIHYSNGWTETYDPKASSSCEVLWDKEARYARVWIESQNPARIIVRVRAALTDPDGYIAHSDIPSSSPYGKGDWTDEWYYIYPDGMHIRYVRIYTGLAAQSLTVTDQTFEGRTPIREIPPNVVHEFQEEFVFGLEEHLPDDDIEPAPLTLIMMDGRSKSISYTPYPKDFGEFSAAPIMLINLKSQYRPYTISIPLGIENEPYPPEGELPHIFQTWPRNPKENGYSTSLGHILNWWHYLRTENRLEQVYLSGMTNAEDPAKELLPLAESWLRPPQLQMYDVEPEYNRLIFDPAQRAYIIPREDSGPQDFKFALTGYEDPDDDFAAPVWIINPAFIIKNWGKLSVTMTVNNKIMQVGKDFRIGYEKSSTSTDLILWLNMRSDKSVKFSITPAID